MIFSVKIPVPGPSSTMTFACSKGMFFSIFVARKRELGMSEPTILFSLKN
jgi:hypothetical protein